MLKQRRALTLALLVTLVAYVAVGLGYNRLSSACFESRYSLDGKGAVLDGAIGAAIDGVLWPVFVATIPRDISCRPRPLGE